MIRIAQVGANNPFTSDDCMRVSTSLYEFGRKIPWNDVYNDIINLHYNRDFLKESRKYDWVIVHSIFHTHPRYLTSAKTMSDKVKLDGEKNGLFISSRHSLENWRKRLIKTNAELISICEGLPFTLSGWNIGELYDYSIKRRDAVITIYEKTK